MDIGSWDLTALRTIIQHIHPLGIWLSKKQYELFIKMGQSRKKGSAPLPENRALIVHGCLRNLFLVPVNRILVDLFLAADIDCFLVVCFLRAGSGKI